MAKQAETSITQAIIARIKELGGWAYHVHGSAMQPAGLPDIDGCLPDGRHIKVEVKTPTGKPSELQKHYVTMFARYGYITGFVTSVEEFNDLIGLDENA